MQEPIPPAVESATDSPKGSDDASSADHASNPVPQIISIELRVLAALMEKELTTPDQYPLTLNSLISACNQKSSRDPVTQYNQGEVVRALQQLQQQRFVDKEFGSRAEKYSQRFIKHLELGKKHQALLCVMMLRGPQTLSELNTRTQRMVDFAGKEDLEHTLDRLCSREVPYVVRLSQRPGQRGERFAHLFSGNPVGNPVGAPAGNANARASGNAASSPSAMQNTGTDTGSVAAATASRSESVQGTSTPSDSQTQIESLQEQIDTLTQETNVLKQHVAKLLQLNGVSTDDD